LACKMVRAISPQKHAANNLCYTFAEGEERFFQHEA